MGCISLSNCLFHVCVCVRVCLVKFIMIFIACASLSLCDVIKLNLFGRMEECERESEKNEQNI